ncbi:MAG: hypothetical protein ACJAU6_003424 [Alphaproteobacteria bacterium]|jgi:hypothetical protein
MDTLDYPKPAGDAAMTLITAMPEFPGINVIFPEISAILYEIKCALRFSARC